MPTTVAGLLIFVVLLAPGFGYVLRRERRIPAGEISIFRETVSLVLSSFVALIAVLGLFAVLRVLLPEHTPDVGRLVREPGNYWHNEYAYLALWGLGLLLLACSLAWLSADPPTGLAMLLPNRLARRSKQVRDKLWPARAFRIAPISGWHRIFTEGPGLAKRVTCGLDDGSMVEGWLWSFDPAADDSADRDLLLSPPFTIRYADGREEHREYGGMAISARRMIFLHVAYRPGPPDAPTALRRSY
jgi:hypothetical protein